MTRSWFIVALLLPVLAAAQGTPVFPEVLLHDFGTVAQGRKVAHDFEIRNPSERELRLERADTTASGMKIRMPPAIPAGGSARIGVEWDTAAVAGRTRSEIVVVAKDEQQPLRLVLAGTVQPPIEFKPMRAAFFSVWKGEERVQTIDIVNNDARPLAITRIEPKGTHFRAQLDTKQAGRAYVLRVTAPAGTAPGRYMESLTLFTDDPRYPEIAVPVNVFVKPEVYANPERIEFGRVPLAMLTPGRREMLTQTFLVKKRFGSLHIEAIDVDSPALTVTRDPPAGASDVFRIDVALKSGELAKRSLRGTLRIRTDDPQFPLLTIPVSGELE